MPCPRRVPVVACVLSCALLLASCTGDNVLQPDATAPTVPPPSFDLLDGSTGGNSGFYFLPPLVNSPTLTGTFNPDLLPSVDVCLLTVDMTGCEATQPNLPSWPAGTIVAADGKYQVNWDTNDIGWAPLDPDRNYRIRVWVSGVELGHMDVNPQDPNGTTPGEDYPGLYAFSLGNSIPIKFWIGIGALCESSDPAVIECAEESIVDDAGGTLKLTNLGDILAVTIVPNSLPGGDPITVVVERLDESALGEPCLPGLDAPRYGPCFRIRALGLDGALVNPAVVSICADPSTFGLPPGQDAVQIHRFSEDGHTYGLANASTADCTQQVGLMKVPDHGLMRYAALGVNALARLVGPEPLAAAHLGLGGLTSSFSRFQWVHPGGMTATAGDGVVLQASDTKSIPATVQVLDDDDLPVEGATVHFSTTSGTVGASAVTGTDGLATVTWDLTGVAAGAHTLTASATGLWVDLPDHTTGFQVDLESITLTATIVGPAASVTGTPTGTVAGTAGETVSEPLSILVTDANGNPVSGAGVTWSASGDGSVTGSTATGSDGTATGTWTLATTAGANTATATVGGVVATFNATGAPAAAANLAATPDPVPDGYLGTTVALSVTVTDAYGNVRPGDAVTWTVTGGGGSVSGGAVTDGTGSASATWTLGSAPGVNSVLVDAGGLTHTFTANGICRDGWGTANVNGSVDGAEWACARTADFTANLSGGSTPARAYWMNDGTNLYVAVRVAQTSLDKVNNVRFDFDNDADNVAEAGDDAIGYDADKHTFFDEYLTAKCANSSQSGCGALDTVSQDGAGAVGNNGTYTFYELRHPLSGTPGEDFVRSTGQPLGFYVSLRIGNGAQGNTQWPGFRDFRQITIVGN